MLPDFVLNDLSFAPTPTEDAKAFQAIEDMVRCVSTFVALGLAEPSIRAVSEPSGFFLLENYSLYDWSIDRSIDVDLRLFFLRLITKVPLVSGLPYETGTKAGEFLLSEFQTADPPHVSAPSLGMATLLAALAVSLPYHSRWLALEIRLLRKKLSDDGSEVHDQLVARNVSRFDSCGPIIKAIRREIREQATDAMSIWAKRKLCFPNLEFCVEVQAQLTQLSKNQLSAAKSKLAIIDDAAASWQSSASHEPVLGFKVHPESEATMHQYGDQRLFTRSNGNVQSFELHAMIGGSYRIHIRLDHASRTIVIGYIGRHLPTAKY